MFTSFGAPEKPPLCGGQVGSPAALAGFTIGGLTPGALGLLEGFVLVSECLRATWVPATYAGPQPDESQEQR